MLTITPLTGPFCWYSEFWDRHLFQTADMIPTRPKMGKTLLDGFLRQTVESVCLGMSGLITFVNISTDQGLLFLNQGIDQTHIGTKHLFLQVE